MSNISLEQLKADGRLETALTTESPNLWADIAQQIAQNVEMFGLVLFSGLCGSVLGSLLQFKNSEHFTFRQTLIVNLGIGLIASTMLGVLEILNSQPLAIAVKSFAVILAFVIGENKYKALGGTSEVLRRGFVDANHLLRECKNKLDNSEKYCKDLEEHIEDLRKQNKELLQSYANLDYEYRVYKVDCEKNGGNSQSL